MSPAQLCVLGLDTQVYKQICKCQITEGDAETGEKSDMFSKKKQKTNKHSFPCYYIFRFLIFFVFPSTVTSVIEEKTGLQSVNISSQLNLSRRMLIHSTVRKCNSLLEEKILLLYWPPPKIPLNTPPLCTHSHTKAAKKQHGSFWNPSCKLILAILDHFLWSLCEQRNSMSSCRYRQ